jgi:hypothetical protein
MACLSLAVKAQSPSSANTDSVRTDAFLEQLLKQHTSFFGNVLANRDTFNVQIIYTKIDRGANGIAGLKHYYFNVNPARYFCPSTTVKLPLAMLTLQKLSDMKQQGVDKNSTMLTGKEYSGQTAVYNDPTTFNGKPNIGQYIKKMLIVSDEDACNRLYEFLGQQYIRQQLHEKGYGRARIVERIGHDLSDEENSHTNPVRFLAPGNKLLYEQPLQFGATAVSVDKDSLANTNTIVLDDLHDMLISLVFPNKVTSSRRFLISDDDRKYLLKYMSQLPTETSNPPYIDEPQIYFPAYSKFVLFGAGKDSIPPAIRVFNISGESEGSVTDIAYITDFDKKIEFFLSVTIDCGEDKYETMSLPFMQHLGKVMYEYELTREKKIGPGLDELKFDYDVK